jgi:hypothetical protein
MPTSDKPGFPDECYLCERAAGSIHHVSYVPEKVVLVCSSCHQKIHSTSYDGSDLYPELTPDMSRGEWQEDYWDGEWIPRPTAEEIDWGADDVGRVER